MKDQVRFPIGATATGEISVDAMVLADTRALINASSGLGKSWLLRLIAEHVASAIQTIIIDPEGEFPSLREKLDILIVSENGDLRADIRSARLLARRLAETGVSAVIDIYDMPGPGDPWVKRRMFVAEFLTELMNLPKRLYHPMIVMVDEAHQFAQEKVTNENFMFNGEKVKPAILSRSAVRSMMSAGRKRGIGGILATQRISKIDKDAIADVRNYFIGGTTLDIDQERAGDILGMSKSEYVLLRELEPGAFYSFGPALIDRKGIVQFVSGQVQTTHPKPGQKASFVVPKASTQISGIVEQIGDLPAIAEEEAKTLEMLQKENADLRRQMRERPTQTQTKTETKIERVEVPVIQDEQIRMLEEHLSHVQRATQDVREIRLEIEKLFNGKIDALNTAALSLSAAIETAGKPAPTPRVTAVTPAPRRVAAPNVKIPTDTPGVSQGLTNPQQRILDSMAWLESIGLYYPKRTIIAFLAGQSPKSSGFTNNLGALRSAGLLTYPSSDSLGFTDLGRAAASPQKRPLATADLQHAILSRLPRPQGRILEVLIENYPDPVNREALAEQAGQSPKSSGYTNNLGALRSLGVIDYPSSTEAVALPVLFLE